MAGPFTFLFVIFIFIVISGLLITFEYYSKRQLVKANFWLNLAIFGLLALVCMVMIIVFFLE